MQNSDFLKKRADSFFESGKEQIQKKRYFLAALHFEQAAQLYLKDFLFARLKDFPRTHSLQELLINAGRAAEKAKAVEEFLQEHINVISDLEQSYITSRYLPVEFSKMQVEKMAELVGLLLDFLQSL